MSQRLKKTGAPLPLRAPPPDAVLKAPAPLQLRYALDEPSKRVVLRLGCTTCRRCAEARYAWDEFLPRLARFEDEEVPRLRAELHRDAHCDHSRLPALQPPRFEFGAAHHAARGWKREQERISAHYQERP